MKPDSSNPPPRWPAKLLNWLVAPHLREEVLGDLHERYARRVQRLGERRARATYWREVLAYMRPRFIRRKPSAFPQPTPMDMIRNYLKIAWRNTIQSASLSIINGFSLLVGLACALLIFIVIRHETSYDQHQRNADRIYRVETFNVNNANSSAGTYTEMGTVLRNEAPEFEEVVPIHQEWGQSIFIPSAGKAFKENVAFADAKLFDLLDSQWLTGDARSALSQPNQVLLTESYAQKFFGSIQVVGKTIQYGDRQTLLVAGVLKDFPTTTNFPLNVLVSFPTLKRVSPDYDTYGWNGFGDNYQVYVLLKSGIKPEQLDKRFSAIQAKYQKDPKTIQNQRFVLNPLYKLHYSFNFSGRQANAILLNILLFIGIFVLLLACINFVNLTTAKALKRAKEVGIRKAIGSNRLSLFFQFMTEAGLHTFLTAILSLLLAWAMLPATANLMSLPLTHNDLLSGQVGVFIVSLLTLTTILAGAYPAFRLSGMSPLWALKQTKLPNRERSVTLRQGLVVVQFTVTIVLICGTLFVHRQLSLFQNADLGFTKDAIVTIGLPDNQFDKLQALRTRLMQLPPVKNVSFSLNSPSSESNWMSAIQYRKGAQPIDIRTQMKWVDAHFLQTYGIKLLAGEAFREGDTLPKFIANEVFLKRMGIDQPEKAIGQVVHFGNGNESAPIIGVVKTFHVNSLHQGIDPTLLGVVPKHFYQAGIKLQSGSLSAESLTAALTAIESIWKTTFPNRPFEYNFLDETLAQAYQNETRMAKLVQTATAIAILIACLGLFGLATFIAESRTKEIGVRMVLGASVGSIVTLLSKDFLKPVLVALILAAPIAWYAISEWLKNFEYKVSIDWWVFGLSGTLAVSVALLTVSLQSIKAALVNPVKSLRSE